MRNGEREIDTEKDSYCFVHSALPCPAEFINRSICAGELPRTVKRAASG